MMRIDKYLADAGRGTRSEVKKLISAGRVSVNGIPVKDPGYRLPETENAMVCIDGRPVRYAALEYYMLNKPQGVISATKDEAHGAVCVTDLIKDKIRKDLFPVGRLDKDTEGLLLITNDGDLCHRLLSPKNHVDKTYYVELDGRLTDEMICRLEEGVDIGDEKPTLPCRIELSASGTCSLPSIPATEQQDEPDASNASAAGESGMLLPETGGRASENSDFKPDEHNIYRAREGWTQYDAPNWRSGRVFGQSGGGREYPMGEEGPVSEQIRRESPEVSPCRNAPIAVPACRITIHEGRYHQIRRMFETQGLTVTFLKRLSMGPLLLDDSLAPGQYRRLTQEEISALKSR